MTITYHPELIQGSAEWAAARCGLLTASEMHLILTPTLKAANNDKERSHLYELLAQRITKYVEPSYVSDDMLRGIADEVEARILYDKHYHPVLDYGFVTNDKFGFTIGYSPDGFVGEDGLLEIKSRRQKFQIETILDGNVPIDYMLQCQTGLLVTERKWLDFVSYSGGLPWRLVRRVYPIEAFHNAIVAAAKAFEEKLATRLVAYEAAATGFLLTERRIEQGRCSYERHARHDNRQERSVEQ